MIRRSVLCAALAATLAAAPALAKVSPEEAARLGKDLTPVGAERAGNAAGTIGEWAGEQLFSETQRSLTPEKLEAIRQGFEQIRADNPGLFESLVQAIEKLDPASYDAISAQIDAIIAKLPPDLRKLAAEQREQMGGGDKPLFVITRDNLAEHAAHLTEGQKAMFAKYPSYRMVVYPTRRSAFFPEPIYEATGPTPPAPS